jgi:hypothetical protein
MFESELDRLYKQEVVKDYLREAENDRLSRKTHTGGRARRVLITVLLVAAALGAFALVTAIENGANVVAIAR